MREVPHMARLRFKVITVEPAEARDRLEHIMLVDGKTCDPLAAQVQNQARPELDPDKHGAWLYLGSTKSRTTRDSPEMVEHVNRWLRQIAGMTDDDEVVFEGVRRLTTSAAEAHQVTSADG
jgi:hypothetical protein